MPVPVTDTERAAVAASSLGSRKPKSGRSGNPDLKVKFLHESIRFHGLNGRRTELFAALDDARNFIATLRTKPDRLHASRGELVSLGAGLLHFDAASRDTLLFVPDDDPAPNLRATAARLAARGKAFDEVSGPASAWLDNGGPAADLAEADLGIVMDYALLAPIALNDSDAFLTKFHVLETAVRLARKSGLRVVAIPDFAFNTLETRPENILAFHTAGRMPGFVHFKRGDLPRFLILDTGGYSGWSTLSGVDIGDIDLPPLPVARDIYQALKAQIVEANVSAYAQDDLSTVTEPLPARYVFVPMQVPGDRTQKVARFTMAEMLTMVTSRFRGTDIAVVVKPHPKSTNLDQLASLIALAEAGEIVLRSDSIHRLIAQSEAVITINSGVGSESILHGKPIYCLGAADYDAVAHRIVSPDQFVALTTPIRPAVSDSDLIRFSAYYRTRYLVEWDAPGRLDAAMQARVIDPILQARRN